ncbi:hypothetical protein [Burkholderia gladioli]|uniref:hypothetical protein n=1 Tax=Burkholderia gladioli TaxID=28095 RepID=UPI0015E30EFD|nr:hypothetical protein [Burkholderia gladioli]
MMVRIVGQTARAGGTDRVPMLSGHCLASAARLGFAFDREVSRGACRARAFSGTVKQCMANFARDRRRLPKDGGVDASGGACAPPAASRPAPPARAGRFRAGAGRRNQ